MTIQVTERISFKPYAYGYTLTELYQTRDNKTKELVWNEDGSPKLSTREYYYANINQCIDKVIYLAGKDADVDSLEGLKQAWLDCTNEIKRFMKGKNV